MKPGKYINTHPWLFVGLAALPACIQALFFIIGALAVGTHHSDTYGPMPYWVCYVGWACLPISVGIIGFALAYCLSVLLEKFVWMSARRLSRVYIAIFTFVWVCTFGFLSFFAFGMGDCATPNSGGEFIRRLTGVICFGIPKVALIALLLCVAAITIVVIVFELIAAVCKAIRL